jgi:site-specific recombinase XerD
MHPLRVKFEQELRIRGRAERTIHAYVTKVRELSRYYGRSPEKISDGEIRAWLHHLIVQRRLAGETINVAVNAVRAFHALVLGRDRHGMGGLPRHKVAPTRAEVYAVSEIAAMVQAPARARDRAFLAVVYACGLRLEEAIKLRTGDVDTPRGQLRVRCGKGNKPRVLPLGGRLSELLRAYWRAERVPARRGEDLPLFVGVRTGRPMSKGTAQNIYYRAVRAAGVKRKAGIHTLRHSFATHLLEAGVAATQVQQWLGHSSLLTTVRYLHVTAGRIDPAALPLGLIELPPAR